MGKTWLAPLGASPLENATTVCVVPRSIPT
jgi:hypothetical protein